MRKIALLGCLLAGSVAAGQNPDVPREAYEVAPLAFEISVPEGWTARHDHTGLVAFDGKRNGFQVSREPMLLGEDEFPGRWQQELRAAAKKNGGEEVEVDRERVGGHRAWRARWTSDAAGGRTIEVWRVHVEDVEMLYNVSFSLSEGFDVDDLAKDVMRTFEFTGERPELTFQKTREMVTNRVLFSLPEGYVKVPRRRPGGLGGGLSGGFEKTLPGYGEKPHQAGHIAFRQIDPRFPIRFADGEAVQGRDTDGLLEKFWTTEVAQGFADAGGRPRIRAARHGGLKGDALEMEVRTKDGLPKVWYGFCGNDGPDGVLVTILVDARETRLYRDLFKDILDQLELRG